MANQGIFLRHYLDQTPGANDPGAGWTNSPDIVASVDSNGNPQPAPDPTVFTSSSGYGQQFSNQISIGQANYIYVRGLNTTGAATLGRFWFYFVESNVVLWPQNWQSSNITVAGNNQNYADMTTPLAANQVGVTNPPFIWTAPNLQQSGDHYCMIAFAQNVPTGQPLPAPQSPAPTGFMGSWDQLAQFVINNPNMAWRNTVDVSRNTPTFQYTTNIAGAPNGGQFNVGVQLTSMPTDGYFAFSVPGPDAQDSVVIPKTAIPNPNYAPTVTVNWPKGYQSSITISYWQGATTPPVGSTITPIITIPFTQVAKTMPEVMQASRGRRKRFSLSSPMPFLNYESPRMMYGAVQYSYIVGSMPYRFS